MKKEIVKILCCPVCKSSLTLEVKKEEDGDIKTGLFTCGHCKVTYPIKDGIPDLLPRET